MILKIYNAKSNKKELIKLITEKKYKIYSCGPTIYNHLHIGNLRPLLIIDFFVRFLKCNNFSYLYVSCITDISDKIIDKSKEQNKTENEIINYYEKMYLVLIKELNLLNPIIHAKASEFIQEISNFITKIELNNFAYRTKNNIFFNTQKYKSYGSLSNRNLDTNLHRKINFRFEKKHFNDFALWKFTNIGNTFESTLGCGRPGWSIECSAIANHFFKEEADFAFGGKDLLFPHHENMSAQNFAYNYSNFARIWIHVGHIQQNNQKMAKTTNNLFLAKDFLKLYDVNVLRYCLFKSHYQRDFNIDEVLINEAIKKINNWKIIFLKIKNLILEFKIEVDEIINNAILNNFNFSIIYAELNKSIKNLNKFFNYKKNKINFFLLPNNIKTCINKLMYIFYLFGLKF